MLLLCLIIMKWCWTRKHLALLQPTCHGVCLSDELSAELLLFACFIWRRNNARNALTCQWRLYHCCFPKAVFLSADLWGVKQVRSMSRTQKSSLFFPTDLTITPKESHPRVTELFLFFVPYIYLLPVLNNKMCSHCGLTDYFVCKMSKSLFSDVQTPPKSQRFWIYSGVVQSSFIQHNFKIFHSH